MGFLDFLPLIGDVATGIFGIGSQVSANEANMELAQYNWEQQKEMWNMNNEYNKPSSQMARYLEAGLNPNLIYGSGSASAGNSTSTPTPQMAHIEPMPVPNFGSSLESVVNNLRNREIADADIKQKESVAKYNEAAAENQKQQGFLNAAKVVSQNYANSKTEVEKQFWYRQFDALTSRYESEADIADNTSFFLDASLDSRLKQSHTAADNAVKDGIIKDNESKKIVAEIQGIGANILYLQKKRALIDYELNSNPDEKTVKELKERQLQLNTDIKEAQNYILQRSKEIKVWGEYIGIAQKIIAPFMSNMETASKIIPMVL